MQYHRMIVVALVTGLVVAAAKFFNAPLELSIFNTILLAGMYAQRDRNRDIPKK